MDLRQRSNRVASDERCGFRGAAVKPANPLFAGLGTTVFETMSRWAAAHDAINLGQGYPEGLEPPFLLAAAVEALRAGPHQYPPMMGTLDLRQAVAETAARFYGLEVDAESEVMVTSGATEALADSLLGLLSPGDEAIVVEPSYDSYVPIIRQAGATPIPVRLEPPDWRLPRAALAAAFGPRTKLIVVNTPMNPTGKVFDAEELAFLADLLQRYDAYAVCDEVYEHLVYAGHRHLPLMTLPGMRTRTVRIGSAGKTFSVTGWKVGYVTACPALLQPIARVHQFLTFTTPPALQSAVAVGLRAGSDYFDGLTAGLAAKRDRLADGLRQVGFDVLPAAGSYFLVADIRPLGWTDGDVAFCRFLVERVGVAAIPVSAFFAQGDVNHLIRFCFAKPDERLTAAIDRLQRFFGQARGA